jgi:hypothetical protein
MQLNTINALGKLTPHPVNINHIAGATPSLTCEDVAGSLGIIENHLSCLLLYKYCHDLDMGKVLVDYVKTACQGLFNNNCWSMQYIDEITDVALVELFDDKNCRICKGSKIIISDNKQAECHSCNGKGVKRYSERYKARLSGINKTSWNRKYSERYEAIFSMLTKWETQGLNEMYYLLNDDN